jgi:hypothetical protein
MTFALAPPTATPSTLREPAKTLREKGADSFYAALAAVLAAGLEDALEAGDHPRAISFINRGFAEGSPQLAATSSAGPLRSSGQPGLGPYRSRP